MAHLPALRGDPRWLRPAWRRPAVATPEVVRKLLAVCFAAGGATTLLSTLWSPVSGDRRTVALAIEALLAVVIAPSFLLLRRIPLWLVNLASASGTVTVTLAVHLGGGGGNAAALATLYLLVVLPSFYLYSRTAAWTHVALAGATALLVLYGNDAIGMSEIVLGAGVGLTLAVLVSWLVRAADLAETDYLTGLTNRRGFEVAAHDILHHHTGAHPLALVMIDLDDFKSVNERGGRRFGDEVLLDLAARWRGILPDTALLARHGGDEFAAVLEAVADDTVCRVVKEMAEVADETSFSAGVAWRTDGESLSKLVLRAEAAVYDAKRLGRGQVVIAPTPSGTATGQEILDALAAGQFVVNYQPIVDLDTGAVDEVEALVRWIHPVEGVIPPGRFISLAEASGAIVPLGDWVLRTTCREAATWGPNVEGRPITASVNVSGLELRDPSYSDRVLGHLADAGLDPHRLVIELVESDYNLDSPPVRVNLAALAAAGVGLAIDDFGTGYSSLNRLDQADVQVLKIDRSFIARLTSPTQAMPLVEAILAMARALDLQVIAEGIETPEQALWLRANGCTHGQGYLFGRPGPFVPSRFSLPTGTRVARPRNDRRGPGLTRSGIVGEYAPQPTASTVLTP
ncbi:MAG: putative bifunctional diguanylate cyclase/phosphodiesterase [Acidimicrobiia bacterium]